LRPPLPFASGATRRDFGGPVRRMRIEGCRRQPSQRQQERAGPCSGFHAYHWLLQSWHVTLAALVIVPSFGCGHGFG